MIARKGTRKEQVMTKTKASKNPQTRKFEEDMSKLTYALLVAKAEALEVARKTEFGGTCNFDCPILIWDTEKWGRKNKKKMELLREKLKNADLSDSEGYGVWRGETLIHGLRTQQGTAQTNAAMAFSKKLEEFGYKSSVFYAID